MTRIVINKPKNKICEICSHEYSLYSFSSHLKFSHHIDANEYALKYGEYRKQKRILKRNIQKIHCAICGNEYSSVGMSVHLRDSHNMNFIEEYIRQYGEFRLKKLKQIDKEKNSKTIFFCAVCGSKLFSERYLSYHIVKRHNITKSDYIKKYIFNNENQLCKCGCGKKVKLKNQFPYRVEYISGHNSYGKNNPMYNKLVSESTKQTMSDKAILRMKNNTSKFDTAPEREFKNFLELNNIEYIQQYPTVYGSIDFYLPKHDILVEIDGEYWHPLIKENLNFPLVSGFISEKKKENLNNLYRIRESDINKIQKIDDILKLSTNINTDISYQQVIISKEYFQNYITKHNKEKLNEYIWLLLKFVRAFQPKFPIIETKEFLNDVILKISKNNNVFDETEKVFSNNISNAGVSYLKSKFVSYWKSRYVSNVSPINMWNDDKVMKDVIRYRIGINDSNEIYNFSLHQLVRGISARRACISFFKPQLAANIYRHFLKDIDAPIVIDPCAGFGGRMLGFKSVYPNGKYIGIEPNIETYNELKELAKNFKNIELHNCKLEEYTGDANCDFTFTSVPYYNTEIYSDNINKTEIEWKNMINYLIKNYKNVVINISEESYNLMKFEYLELYYLKNNTSHFNKTDINKIEFLLKVN